MDNKKFTILATLAGLAILASFFMAGYEAHKEENPGGGDGFTASACTMTHSVVSVGRDITATILSANSKRASARIAVLPNATTSQSLSFGGTAAQNTGIVLNSANLGGVSSTPSIDFGLNTDLPYTGAVTGLSSFGTSSVLVSQCIYNR